MNDKIHDGEELRPQAAKKPYRKPQVRREKIFETQALICGKIFTNQRQCQLVRRTS